MNLKFTIAGVVLMLTVATGLATGFASNTVAVLDFVQAGSQLDQERVKVSADFMEMSLQREGVATLERRQIHLILGERNLWQDGVISSATIHAAKLPLPEFFVQGTVRGGESNQFSLEVVLVRAQSATLEMSFSDAGNFPDDWPTALDMIAKQIASRLNQVRQPPPNQTRIEGITWMPETAFKFFRGIERYAGGDYGGALAMFHELRVDDRSSKPAWLWEARCYKRCGLPEQAELILKKMRLTDEPAALNSVAQNRPVVAVLAASEVSEKLKQKLAQSLADSGKVLVFDPAWIGATAREVDLQLTGAMAVPSNTGGVWLAVDSIIQLDTVIGRDGSGHLLRLRQQDLLSGKVVFEASVQMGGSEEENSACKRLAEKYFNGQKFPQTWSIPLPNQTALEEPGIQDSATTALAKALRLVQQTPGDLRFRIGLADGYSPWTGGMNYLGTDRHYPMDYYLKMLCLDQVIHAIEKQKEQPDAPFLLASALWRKRVTRISQPWKHNIEGDHWNIPHEREFHPLFEWFPNSADSAVCQQLTNFDQPPSRYLQSVYSPPTNNVPRTVGDNPDAVARINTDLLADLSRFAQQTNHLRAFEIYWCLLRRGVPAAQLNEAFPRLDSVYWEQQNFYRDFNAQTNKFDQHGQMTSASRNMMASCNAELRMFAFRNLLEAAEKELTPAAAAAVRSKQVRSYLDDFGALTSADGNLAVDLQQLLMCWRKVNAESGGRHYEFAKDFYEIVRQSPYVGQARRLTADYDLATDCVAQKKYFEASELLKEILTETEHGSMEFDRGYTMGGGDLRDSALALLKKIRLFGDVAWDLNQCGGTCQPIQEPSAGEAAVIESLFQQWVNAGQPGNEGGAEKAAARTALVSHGQAILPLLIRELELGKVARWQLFWVFSALGTKATPAIPYILPYVSSDRSDSLGAINTLIQIGQPAACAIPLLIATAEQDDPYVRLNAEEAIQVLGTAPPQAIPYLARLLYHQNPAICRRVAKAIIAAANLSAKNFAGKTDDELVLSIRNWWETDGIKATQTANHHQ